MTLPTFPVLDDIIKESDVSTKGGGKFAASYVNWSKVSHLLRKHAPGWQPFTQTNLDGGMLHTAPDGTFYLMIGFVNDDQVNEVRTVCVPHAVMDHKMAPKKNPDSRDVSDAFVRGMCKAAALLFGLGWRLWSKDDPFEREDEPAPRKVQAKQALPPRKFATPELAIAALNKCVTEAHIGGLWTAIVNASDFADEEKANLLEAATERLAHINEG